MSSILTCREAGLNLWGGLQLQLVLAVQRSPAWFGPASPWNCRTCLAQGLSQGAAVAERPGDGAILAHCSAIGARS